MVELAQGGYRIFGVSIRLRARVRKRIRKRIRPSHGGSRSVLRRGKLGRHVLERRLPAVQSDKPRRALVDWLQGSGDCAALFDFPTKGILQEAVKRGEFWRLADSQRPARTLGMGPAIVGGVHREPRHGEAVGVPAGQTRIGIRVRAHASRYRSCSLHISGAMAATPSRIGASRDFTRRFARFSTFVNARACVARAFWTLRSRSGIFTSPLRMTPSP